MSASDKTPPCPKTWERPGATLRCMHPGGEGHKGICTWPNPESDTLPAWMQERLRVRSEREWEALNAESAAEPEVYRVPYTHPTQPCRRCGPAAAVVKCAGGRQCLCCATCDGLLYRCTCDEAPGETEYVGAREGVELVACGNCGQAYKVNPAEWTSPPGLPIGAVPPPPEAL